LGKVTVTIIDGFEFIAVDGDDRLVEKVEGAAKHYTLSADTTNGLAIAFAKVSGWTESG
jgi:hypothetical protein